MIGAPRPDLAAEPNSDVEFCLSVLRGCAAALGREFKEPAPLVVGARIRPADARQFRHALEVQFVRIDGNRIATFDPYQETAWLVEGAIASPCWEYVPHIAAYDELLNHYPRASVRFEVPDHNLHLDLAVVTAHGAALVLGEVKVLGTQLDAILQLLPLHSHADPGLAPTKRAGGPSGFRRDAWKLVHQLWTLRPRYLWLVAADDRRPFKVDFLPELTLSEVSALPDWPADERVPAQHQRLVPPEPASGLID